VSVSVGEELAFLHPRPVSDLWGVGPRTAERLSRYGVHTIAELAALGEDALCRLVGHASGAQLHALASGRDERGVVADRAVKSIGHEETFSTDRHDPVMLHRELVRLSDAVGSRLRAAAVVGRTVTLKVRFGDFTTITRSRSSPVPFLSASEIAEVSTGLLDGVDVSAGVRLIGVSVSSLERHESAGGRQLALLGMDVDATADGSSTSHVARGDVDRAVGAIRQRYGAGAVGPATIAGPGGVRVKQFGDAQWGAEDPEDAPAPGRP
jgi:DNA polymerase-4